MNRVHGETKRTSEDLDIARCPTGAGSNELATRVKVIAKKQLASPYPET